MKITAALSHGADTPFELHLRELERRVGAVGEGRGDLHLRTIRSQHPHGHIATAVPGRSTIVGVTQRQQTRPALRAARHLTGRYDQLV